MLLAVGISIAGYSYALALRRGPARSSEPVPVDPPLPKLQAPERLPPDPELRRQAVPASVVMDPQEPSRIAIVLRDIPPFLDANTAGVAMFAADTGAEFTWTPLSTFRDGNAHEITTPIVGPVTFTVARSRGQARHGYLIRTTHTFPRSRGPLVALPILAAAHQVRFELANKTHTAGPLRLRRLGDDGWRATDAAPTGLSFGGSTTIDLVLGAGDYELGNPNDPTQTQRFTVPAMATIAVSATLSRPASARL